MDDETYDPFDPENLQEQFEKAPVEPASKEQWFEGQELTLHAGMDPQEIRATALSAAAQLLAMTGQPGDTLLPSVIQTANAFCDYIQKGSVRGL